MAVPASLGLDPAIANAGTLMSLKIGIFFLYLDSLVNLICEMLIGSP